MAARSPIGGRVAILLTRTERCAPSDAQRSAAALRSSSSWLIPTTRRIVLYVIGLISRTRFECRSDLTMRRGGYIDHGQYCRDGLSSWGDLQQAAGWLFTPAWAME